MGIGRDKQNESVTVSKDGFLKAWSGNVSLESQKIQLLPSAQNKILSAEDAKKVRGAFWGSLLAMVGSVLSWIPIPVLQQIGWGLTAISIAVSAIEGDFLTAITSAVSVFLPGLRQLFGNVFDGIGESLGSIGQTFQNAGATIYNSVTGFINSAINFLPGVGPVLQSAAAWQGASSVGALVVNTALKMGVEFSVTRGLESLGVGSQIAGFFGSLTANAITAGLKPESSIQANGQTQVMVSHAQQVQNALQQTITISQIGNLGMQLGLAPELTQLASLSVGAIQGAQILNPGGPLEYAFSEIAPNLVTTLGQYGLSELSNAIGLPPIASQMVGNIGGAALSAGLGFSHAGMDIVNVINNETIRNAVSLGMTFGMEALQIAPSASQFIFDLMDTIKVGGQSIGSRLVGAVVAGYHSAVDFLAQPFRYLPFAAQELKNGIIFSLNSFQNFLESIPTIFTPQTREAIYQNETSLSSAQIERDGDVYRFQSGSSIVEYDVVRDVLTETTLSQQLEIKGFGWNSQGEPYYQNLSYRSVLENGLVLEENFDGQALTDWSYLMEGRTLVKVNVGHEGPFYDIDDFVESGSIEMAAPITFQTTEASPTHEIESYDAPFRFVLSVSNGSITSTTAEIIREHVNDSRLDEDLYVLVNGIANENIRLEGSPQYLQNLETDLVSRSQGQIQHQDIIKASTFFNFATYQFLSGLGNYTTLGAGSVYRAVLELITGEIQNSLSLMTKDIVLWLAEVSNPARQSLLVGDIRRAVEGFFSVNPATRQRDIIGVGYSGGFVPLTEAVARVPYSANPLAGYNTKSLVAIGAALVRPDQIFNDILLKLLQAADYLQNPGQVALGVLETTLNDLDQVLLTTPGVGVGITQAVIRRVIAFVAQGSPEQAYQEYQQRLNAISGALSNLFPSAFQGFALDDLTGSSTQTIVNLYGTRDILANFAVNGHAIGGYRDDIAGFTQTNRDHQLVNIEIVGATHFDYMRRETTFTSSIVNFFNPSVAEWNRTVSAFVADVVANSRDTASITRFLRNPSPDLVGVQVVEELDRWVVYLPGYTDHE